MQNDLLTIIKTRRSIRSFEQRQIEDAQLNTILEAATWAPSGANSQSWLFTAIQNEDTLRELNEVVRQALIVWEPDEDYAPKLGISAKAQTNGYNFFFHAPTFIIASNRPNYSNAMADCATALQNILLTATSLGLGSCWINHLRWLTDVDSVRSHLAKLGIPQNHMICGAAAIGYAAQTPKPSERKIGTVNIIK